MQCQPPERAATRGRAGRWIGASLAVAVLLAGTAGAEGVPRFFELPVPRGPLAALADDGQLVYVHPPGSFTTAAGRHYDGIRFVTCLAAVAAPLDRVRRVVLDLGTYDAFVPQVIESHVEPAGPGRLLARHRIEVALPVLSLTMDLELEYGTGSRGSIEFHRTGGDLAADRGRWAFRPLPGGRTLVAYTVWADLGSAGLLARAVLGDQPEIARAVLAGAASSMLAAVVERSRPGGGDGGVPAPPTGGTVGDRSGSPTIPLLGQRERSLEAIRPLAAAGTVLMVHPPQAAATPEGSPSLAFATAVQQLAAGPAAVRGVVTDFAGYGRFFGEFRSARVKEAPRGYLVDWQLNVGLGRLRIPIGYTLGYFWYDDHTLPFRRFRGDFRHVYGAWEWMPAAATDSTLLAMTLAVEPGEGAPVLMQIMDLLPNSRTLMALATTSIMVGNMGDWIDARAGKD